MTSVQRLGLALFLFASPAWAQAPQPVGAAEQAKPVVEEERPDFQPLRPAEPEPEGNAEPAPAVPPPPVVPVPVPPVPVPHAAPAVQPPPPPMPPMAEPAPVGQSLSLPLWVGLLALLTGAVLALLGGALTMRGLRRGELVERRRSVAASLATELDTRRLAFESVPLPPNVDAGVSFVSSVISMAGIDCAFRAAQGQLFLFSPQLAANISVHYAAVQRVADFVKGQSMAAAVRMLQANRLGGHPCPDAGAMREAHVELDAAFRGLDKVILSLRAQAR
ncbi:MAG: hypothetical protein HYU59_05390 [Magnetospirillum gryphiswaldense]|nr:hypothetical protein [Magnetospirillum gryphiswaldense]